MFLRDLTMILDTYENGKKFYLFTGQGATSEPFHLGNISPFMFTQWVLQFNKLHNILVSSLNALFTWQKSYSFIADQKLLFIFPFLLQLFHTYFVFQCRQHPAYNLVSFFEFWKSFSTSVLLCALLTPIEKVLLPLKGHSCFC